MNNATELLTAYLAQIQAPAAAAAPFADDGEIELPGVRTRPQGPVEIEKLLTGLLAKAPDFSFQNIRIGTKRPDQAFGEHDVAALVPLKGKTYRQTHAGRLVAEKGKITLLREARHSHSARMKDANGHHNVDA